MKRFILPAVTFLAALVFAVVMASHAMTSEIDTEVETSTRAEIEFFEKQIRPILVEHCYECHAGAEVNGGLLLDSRDGVRRGGDTGPAIVAGNPEKSLLIEAVRYENRELQMPPQNRLGPAQIAALEKWVSTGASDPRESAPQATESGGTQPTGMSIEDGRRFWSFQPVIEPAVPTARDPSWIRTPIDAFVLATLEDKGLQPAPPADRRTLIRRVTLDLIGVPPTSEQIEAFAQNESSEAYDELVERLLASPQYGVRWGRHWLDVARYADSNGLDENLAFGNAWRYRDYVIDAFNEDKPFDQFVIEQIAGDLVPEATEATKTATGFLVLGAKVLAEPDREKLEMDTIDEQLDSTGKAFLGMTFGCVRCHDHKFDPIKQTDYYALAAIFKSTRTFADSNTGAIKHWNEHVFASEEELAAMKDVDAKIAKLNGEASTFKNQAMARLRDQARSLATEYLIAATKVELDMPLSQIAEVAAPLGLHPRILHHCRRHLHFNADDPFFEPWHAFALQHDTDAVDSHYRPLFELAAHKPDPASADEDERVKSARSAMNDLSGFLTVPAKPEFAFDAETLAEYDRLMEVARLHESAAPDVVSAMGVADGAIAKQLPIHIRGSHLNLGDPVSRDVPQVMRVHDETAFPNDQSGRMEFARWMVDPKHPLTARVYVNRVWRWHFGQGIVKSTENFGALGDRPSHPELLDWLASYFVKSGWSTKSLHRLILSSNSYRMMSSHPNSEHNMSLDPENRWLWKFQLQRLEAEQVRDSILAVSDRLDSSLRGKTVPLRNRQFVFNHTSVDHTKYDSLRRAAYLPVIRNNLYSVFEQFDFPDPTMPTGNRNSTVVAPQALLMMNADWVMDSAEQIAKRLLNESSSEDSRVESAYRQVLGRRPTDAETLRVLEFIDTATANDAQHREQAWALFCHSLLASNEFMYVR